MCRRLAARCKGKRQGASGKHPTGLRGLSRIGCQSEGVTRPDLNLAFDQVTYHAGSRSSALTAAYDVNALLEGHRSGRPHGLTAKQRSHLCEILDSGPISYGFMSGVWTSVMITSVITEEFGVSYHPGHVRKLLQELGFSVQRPKRLLAQADKAQQHRWQRYTYPNLKKKRPEKKPH